VRRLDRAAAENYREWLMRTEVRVPAPEPPRNPVPFFALTLRADDTSRHWIRETVESLLAQTWPHWQLSVPDLAGLPGDARIVCENAKGHYRAFLDAGIVLTPFALASFAQALQDCKAELAYSDSDHLDSDGLREKPAFRPDWSPDLLCSPLYPGAFLLTRADFSRTCLLDDAPLAVCHVPRVLYHSRLPASSESRRSSLEALVLLHPGFSAGCPELPLNRDCKERHGVVGQAISSPASAAHAAGNFRIIRPLTGDPLVSIVVCSRNPHLLSRCLSGLARQPAGVRYELIVIHHLSGNIDDDSRIRSLITAAGAASLEFEGAFNFSAMNNLGAKNAHGDVLLFLNDDVEPLVPGWLESLVVQIQRPSVAIAGAQLLYPTGLLQHAGVVVGIGDGCGHPGRFLHEVPHFPWLNLARDVSAVTGACLAIRRQVFDQLGGFDPEFPVNYNDVDLCLRARQAGYRVIYEPTAVLRHDECQTRMGGTTYDERRKFLARWRSIVDSGDPFYNPNLTTLNETVSLCVSVK
jgi:GT2 family glycosyltransferase